MGVFHSLLLKNNTSVELGILGSHSLSSNICKLVLCLIASNVTEGKSNAHPCSWLCLQRILSNCSFRERYSGSFCSELSLEHVQMCAFLKLILSRIQWALSFWESPFSAQLNFPSLFLDVLLYFVVSSWSPTICVLGLLTSSQGMLMLLVQGSDQRVS